MVENFKNNISRIKIQGKEYISKALGLTWPKKILLLIVAILILPNFQAAIMVLIPSLVTLFFINDSLQGRKRGLGAFLLSTISQLLIMLTLFVLLGFNDPVGSMDFFETVRVVTGVTVGGIMLLVPGYLLGILFYDIDLKGPEGKLYLKLCGGVAVLLLVRNMIALVL